MELIAPRIVCIARGIEELTHVSTAISAYLDYSSRWTIERAAAHGLKFLVQHLAIQAQSNTSTHISLVMDFAARNGHLEILQWLHAQTALNSCSTRSMDDAAKNGHLSIVHWLHTNRTEGCTVKAMDYAAMQGHLDIVQWLHMHRSEGCTSKAMDLAAQNGHRHVLVWLNQHREEGCTSRAVEYAACEGHLSILRWLCEDRKMSCTPVAMVKAARCGHLSVLQYLHTTFPTIFEAVGPKLVHAAIANGYVDVMTWLISVLPVTALKCEARREEEQDQTENAAYSCMDVAAEYGQVKFLQWFLEHIGELPKGVMRMEDKIPKCSVEAIAKAAGNGHIDILRFVARHDLMEKHTEEEAVHAIQTAVEGGHFECVEWLVERFQAVLNGHRASTTAIMDAAASTGHVGILDFLHKNSTTSSWRISAKAVNEAARQGILEVLQWIHLHVSSTSEEEAAEPYWTPRSMENAAANGHIRVVQWMVEHRRQATRGVEAMNAAAYMDHLEIVKFLYINVRTSCSVVQAQEHAEEGGAEECLGWLQTLSPQDRP